MQDFAKMVCSRALIKHGIKTKKLEVLKPPMEVELVEKDGKIEAIFSKQQREGHASYSANSPHYPIINNARSTPYPYHLPRKAHSPM